MNCVSNNLKKVGAFCIAGMMSAISFAQQGENLIPNGGFESTDGKVKKLGAIESATGWTSPTGVRADVFTPGKVPEINTPENAYGKEEAKEGSNYAGFVAFSFGDKTPRSYVMVKLDAPLKKGMKYCVSFNVSLAEASKYACNQIGANLSKKPFATDAKTSIIDKAHVLHSDNKIINQTYNWEKVCGVFVAEGGEKYLTIGNFISNENTKYENNKKPKDMKIAQVIAAYYYLDDISVTLVEGDSKCDCAVEEDATGYSTTVYQKSIALNDKMSVNEKIEAQQAFFAFGKINLSPAGKESLDFIIEQMKANPAMKIQINGHSDAKEDEVGLEKPQYADMASKRVNAVMAYMMEKGIDESRLIASPQGSSDPNAEVTDTDDDDLKMAKNRRVTFKVR